MLNGQTHLIEDKFTNYDWKNGVVPHYRDVTLVNGAVLTTDKFNDNNEGGVVMFYVSGTLSICSDCRIDVNAKGWSGERASQEAAELHEHLVVFSAPFFSVSALVDARLRFPLPLPTLRPCVSTQVVRTSGATPTTPRRRATIRARAPAPAPAAWAVR